VPTEQPVTSVEAAPTLPSAEVGDEAAAPVRPGESDEELAQLDEQAAAGTSGQFGVRRTGVCAAT